MVLGDGQGSQRPVKRVPCVCDPALVHEELAVVEPDPRHLWKTTLFVMRAGHLKFKAIQDFSRLFHK